MPPESRGRKNPTVQKCRALLDTGSSGTLISRRLVKSLLLYPMGTGDLITPNSIASAEWNYLVKLKMDCHDDPENNITFDILAPVFQAKVDFDVMVGMDILGLSDLMISSGRNSVHFDLTIPGKQLTDQGRFPNQMRGYEEDI